MKKILVVDDHKENIKMIQKFGKLKSYAVSYNTDPTKVLKRLEDEHFDIIILDVMMDKLDGFILAQKIMKKHDVKIIFLSAKIDIQSRIKGLELGAIDYVTKPFSLEELFLKINNILKIKENNYEFKIDDFLFNIKEKRVFKGNEEIKFTALCFDLLLELCQNSDRVLSRQYLLKKLWGTDEEYSSRTVDAHIVILRNALKEDSNRIQTVRGEGYKYGKNEK